MTGAIIGTSNQLDPIIAWATSYVRQTRRDWAGSKLAVVFDIDDTILVSHSNNRMYSLPCMKEFYKVLFELHIVPFFITARVDEKDNRDYTVKQLARNGYTHYKQLFLMPMNNIYEANFSAYKYQSRQKIKAQGYSIILNLGDCFADHFLMPPYQNDITALKQIHFIISQNHKKQYQIFKPADISWMSIKFPEVS